MTDKPLTADPALIELLQRMLDAIQPITPEEVARLAAQRGSMRETYMELGQKQTGHATEQALLAAERARLGALMDAIDQDKAKGHQPIDEKRKPMDTNSR